MTCACDPRPARPSARCKEQRVCQGKNCSPGRCGNERVDRQADAHHALHGKSVLACTLVAGLCSNCRRGPGDDEERQLRLGAR